MSEIILAEEQTPSNPSAGFRSFHLNASNTYVMKDSTGLETPFTIKSDTQLRDLIAAMLQTTDTALSLIYNSGLGQFEFAIVDDNLVISSAQVTGTNLANGLAKLDATGLIPSAILPSYVDDILEFADLASFPVTGESGKIYVALDTLRQYRWSGTVYQAIVAGNVDSVFSRTGNITAQNGDYNASQITFTPLGNIAAITAQTAIAELDTEKQDKIATGYTATTTLSGVAATDTILQALAKLQYQESLVQRKALTGVSTNSSNVTLTSLTSMAVNVVAGKTYIFECYIAYRSAATTTGIVLTMSGVSATGTLLAQANIPAAADSATAVFRGNITSLNDLVIATSTPVANADFIAIISGTFICTTSGTLVPAYRSEINASLITVQVGSVMKIEEAVSI
jgi:hypothetical protein